MKNYLRSSILAFGILTAAIIPMNVAHGQSIRSNIAPRSGGITIRKASVRRIRSVQSGSGINLTQARRSQVFKLRQFQLPQRRG